MLRPNPHFHTRRDALTPTASVDPPRTGRPDRIRAKDRRGSRRMSVLALRGLRHRQLSFFFFFFSTRSYTLALTPTRSRDRVSPPSFGFGLRRITSVSAARDPFFVSRNAAIADYGLMALEMSSSRVFLYGVPLGVFTALQWYREGVW